MRDLETKFPNSHKNPIVGPVFAVASKVSYTFGVCICPPSLRRGGALILSNPIFYGKKGESAHLGFLEGGDDKCSFLLVTEGIFWIHLAQREGMLLVK